MRGLKANSLKGNSPSDKLHAWAKQASELRAQQAAWPSPKRRMLASLKQWQVQRMAAAHADLLESERYAPAARFFLDELYGAENLGQRDKDLDRLLPNLRRFLPESSLETIATALELDAISEFLDTDLLEVWSKNFAKAGPMNAFSYAAAYQLQSTKHGALRDRQLELVMIIGQQMGVLVRQPFLGGLLKSMKLPAQAAGLGALHSFLVRGFNAFKAMGRPEEFLALIQSRETAQHNLWLNQGPA